jgi:hypothetical protein
MVSALQREGMVAIKAAQFYQEAKNLQEQLSGEKEQPPDPVVELKNKELAIREQEAQGRAQNDQAKLQLAQQKEQNDVMEAQQRLQLQEAALNATDERDLQRIRQQEMDRAQSAAIEQERMAQQQMQQMQQMQQGAQNGQQTPG